MPSFDETKAVFDSLYGGKLEVSRHALNAFATPRTPSGMERAFTSNAPKTALAAAVVAGSILAGRIAL